MPGALFVQPWRPILEQGVIAPGAKAWFTLEGTNTVQPVYSDSDLTTPRTNPVIADAQGRLPPTYLDTDNISYRVRIYAKGATVGVSTPLEEYDPYAPGAFADPLASGNPSTDETIYLVDLGYVADNSTVNLASVAEAYVAALPGANGARVHLPQGPMKLDREFEWNNRPMEVIGYGDGGYNGSVPNGGSVILVPTGYAGMSFKPGAGKSRFGGFSVAQYGSALADGVASYNPASPTTITVSSGFATFLNRMFAWLDGGGPSMAVSDRTIAITSGNNVATVTTTAPVFIGNPLVYVGMPIAIPGAGAAGATLNAFVGAWTTTTITLVNAAGAAQNASTTVSGQQYTVKWPLLCQIQSGGGTATLTVDNPGFQTQAVTNGRLRHAPPAIYATTQVKGRDVLCGMGIQGTGIYLRGTTSDGSNVDGSNLDNMQYLCTLAGFISAGTDAQVITTKGNDFAGPEISMLDMGFLGTQHFGAHFAFNIGPVVTYTGAITTIDDSYMEDGTSFGAPSNARATFKNTRNGLPYSGWNAQYTVGRTTYLALVEAESAHLSAGFAQGGTAAGTAAYLSGNTNSGGSIPGASGVGWLVGNDGASDCYMVAKASPGGTYAVGHIEVNNELRISNFAGFSGWDLGRFINGNFELKTAKGVIIGGNQVITDRQTGTPADATDLATALTLVNAIKAKLITHGLIS